MKHTHPLRLHLSMTKRSNRCPENLIKFNGSTHAD